MNALQEWKINHFKKIAKELKVAGIELKVENITKIIEKTSFKIRGQKYPDECPYYLQEKPCHPEIEDLNCLLCACPQYDSENSKGGCKINSKDGFLYHERIWDCSNCSAYHKPEVVARFLSINLEKILK